MGTGGGEKLFFITTAFLSTKEKFSPFVFNVWVFFLAAFSERSRCDLGMAWLLALLETVFYDFL